MQKMSKSWTLVTAYFNLTKRPDANTACRSLEHYKKSWAETLALPYNLVIFSDDKSLCDLFTSERKAVGHHDKTRVHHLKFEDVPITKYYDRIVKNRREHPYQFDPRNTASYYLLCMSRYHLLERVMAENPFCSTHFGWINVCISRMGESNLKHLDEGLRLYRDKFSTAYIDYQPKRLVQDLPTYYQYGRCGMCSGFFTGNKEHMSRFCKLVQEMFVRVLDAGYGHADEQLFSLVYFENPDLFHFYYADYFQMITNYAHVYENPDITLRLLIPKSRADQNYTVAFDACREVYDSYLHGRCQLNTSQLVTLLDELVQNSWYSGECWRDSGTDKNRTARKLCLQAVQHMARACEKDAAFLTEIRKDAGKYLQNSDYVSVLLESCPIVAIKQAEVAKLCPHMLAALCQKDRARVFVFGHDVDVTHKSFVVHNPIYRPSSIPFNVSPYNFVIQQR